TSGIDDAYKRKWVRDYARTICRNKFGELDTDEFYDSTQREAKARESLEQLNAALGPWGIRVTDVIPQDFHFYEEYEEKIREKKERDQEIEEQKSKAKAAMELQKFVEMEERKKMDVEVARFKGQMEKLRIEAEAEQERVMRQADAYAINAKAAADAEFVKLTKEAEGIRATKTAEAEGILAMVSALQGPGGRNLVKMEYARQLQNLRITGTPVSVDSQMQKFEHSTERRRRAAAASKAVAPPGSSSPSSKRSKR
ncbi:MAG: SPFH domain-containing protein, partial [Alphaproteobacteria bacterium]